MKKLALIAASILATGCGAGKAILTDSTAPQDSAATETTQTFSQFLDGASTEIPQNVMDQLLAVAASDPSILSDLVTDPNAPQPLPVEPEVQLLGACKDSVVTVAAPVTLTSNPDEVCHSVVQPIINPTPASGPSGGSSSCTSAGSSATMSLVSGDCSGGGGSGSQPLFGDVDFDGKVNAEDISGLFVAMRADSGNNGISLDGFRNANAVPGVALDVKDYTTLRFQIGAQFGSLGNFYKAYMDAYFAGQPIPSVSLHRISKDFGLYGDANQDGKVNWDDVTALISYAFQNGSLSEEGIMASNVQLGTYGDVVDISDLCALIAFNVHQDNVNACASANGNGTAATLVSGDGSSDIGSSGGTCQVSSQAVSLPMGTGSLRSIDLQDPAPQPTPTPAAPPPSGTTCPVGGGSSTVTLTGSSC